MSLRCPSHAVHVYVSERPLDCRTGFGTGEAALFGIDISLQFRIDGTVKGPGNVTRVRFKMTGDGEATNGIETVAFTFAAQVKAEITSNNFSSIFGTIKLKVCVRGLRCSGEETEFEVSLDGARALGGEPCAFAETFETRDPCNSGDWLCNGSAACLGDSPPASPGPFECGPDPTPDELGCDIRCP